MKKILLLIILPLFCFAQIGSFYPFDYSLRVAKGEAKNEYGVNKFGRSTNVDGGVDTDIWDGANGTDDQDIWIAPTQARIHNITSNSAADSIGLGGAWTIRIYGLTSWSIDEVSEIITMEGGQDIATSNSYVIIHRMKVLTKGSTGVNVGVITATAVTDGTITAQINAGQGQTQMAIYGISSNQIAYMTGFYFYILKSGGVSQLADCSLIYNPEPQDELTGFVVKHTLSYMSTGNSGSQHIYNPYKKFVGPGIIKLQSVASSNDFDISAGFDLIVVNEYENQ